jgi:hypothetical protein
LKIIAGHEAQPTVNPHWREFFKRIRREAERLDTLERERQTSSAPKGLPSV